MPIGPKRLPILEHLRELRYRLIIIAVVVIVGSVVMYFPAPRFYNLVMEPIMHIFGDQPLILLNPFETFTLRFQAALYATLVIGSPIIIWQVMAFFLPALKPNERRWLVPTFMAMAVLFVGGVAFAHQIIMGAAFEWIVGQAWEGVTQMPEASTYFQGAVLLLLGFGLAFQLPVVVFYLMVFNIVPYEKLRANWRVVYTLLMVLAASATPDWSPVTMLALLGALIALYEASMLFARLVLRRRIARRRVLGY
ncbi:MAG TPA: twin-arginine translocase subunit TatC [Coriobacteriia bacterium]|nr:twin-arginine translocase subunit TatC [Coriobacteriia bacterium]